MTTEERKRFRNRANRAKRELLKEKDKCGYFDDRSGKRYRIPVFYILAGENDKALDFFSWYEKEFPDDIGEPIFHLYWALSEFKAGHKKEASYRLKIAMLANLYMLPFLFQEPIEMLAIWHASNRAHPDYLYEIKEYLDEPTPKEREWIKSEYNTQAFVILRDEYINTFSKLNNEHDIQRRSEILNRWYQFSEQYFKDHD